MPKLSILVPTYNRADYVRECVDSMLVTTVDCEIIVSDNASTDHTEAVMRSYTDARVRYFRQETNIGGTENHNFLLKAARGEYMCLFGDDDRALPNCFERKVALLEAFPHVDLVFSKARLIDPDGNVCFTRGLMGRLAFSYIDERVDFNEFLINCFISWQTLVFRRTVYEHVGPLQEWGLQASIDWFWLQQCMRYRHVAYLSEDLVEVRSHPGSFSVSTAIKDGYFMRDRMILWRRWLLEADDPPVVTDLMWERMAQVVAADVQDVFGPDPAKRDEALHELNMLNWAYTRRMETRFHTRLAIAAHFRPGLPPWPLEGRKGTAFLHAPIWDASSASQVIASYCQAFTAQDDVSLVVWLDPAQGVSVDQATEVILGAVRQADLAPEAAPDVLLVADEMGPPELVRLFSAVDVVVAPTDPLHAERAERVGKPCLKSLTPAAWNAAAGRRAAGPS